MTFLEQVAQKLPDKINMSIQNHFSRIGRLLQQQNPNAALPFPPSATPPRPAAPPATEISPLQALVIQAQQAQRTQTIPPPPSFVADQMAPPTSGPMAPLPAVALGFSGGERLAEVATGDALLEPGDSGSAVQALQRFLSQQGHEVHTSGYFDASTHEAVLAFQNDQGILTDGEVLKP